MKTALRANRDHGPPGSERQDPRTERGYQPSPGGRFGSLRATTAGDGVADDEYGMIEQRGRIAVMGEDGRRRVTGDPQRFLSADDVEVGRLPLLITLQQERAQPVWRTRSC